MKKKEPEVEAHQAETCKTCGTCPTCGSRPGQTIYIRTYPQPYYPWWQYGTTTPYYVSSRNYSATTQSIRQGFTTYTMANINGTSAALN